MAKATDVKNRTFAGTKGQQTLAENAFEVMRGQAMFWAENSPIEARAGDLAEFLSQRGKNIKVTDLLDVLVLNPEIFAVSGAGEDATVITTKAGRAPATVTDGISHDFSRRFHTPLPKPATPAVPPRVRVMIDPSWATLSIDGDLFDDAEEEPAEEEAAVAAATAEIAEPAVAEEPEAEAEVVTPERVEPDVATARTITVMQVSKTDVTGVDDEELAEAIAERLRNDVRIANFGEQWMAEERVPRFSRGDLRRVKEYLQEQEQPLTDDLIVQDVLNIRPNSADYVLLRFAINYRLSREHRDFEFVGTSNQRFWTTSNLPQIGTTRRKPNEIGSDYRFLLEELPEAPEYRSVDSVDRVISFYEYYHGLMPYDAELQALLPKPMTPDQRTAVLTFETPQSYTTYLVELRYPTPNRGGFILGLDDFFTESLVPGALVSISRTENDGHYRVEYLAGDNQNDRLLELDERRAARYVFRPTSFGCAVDSDWIINEDRFPGLGSEKPLDDKVRRRPESVISATFERIGDRSDGPGYSADFVDLMAAVNIERPFSERFLRQILETDETGAFARDTDKADAYTYVPGNVS